MVELSYKFLLQMEEVLISKKLLTKILLIAGLIGVCLLDYHYIPMDDSIGGRIASAITFAFLYALTALVGPIIAGMIRESISEKKAFEIAQNITEFGKVISKTIDQSSFRGTSTKHFVAFEFHSGRRKNFEVSLSDANTILENDAGMVTYKEHGEHLFLIKFQRQVKG